VAVTAPQDLLGYGQFLRGLDPTEFEALAERATPAEVEFMVRALSAVENGNAGWPDDHRKGWLATARANQLPPLGNDWFGWLYMAGRGSGKTRSASEHVAEFCRTHPDTRYALVGERLEDVRSTMVEGALSGLLAVLPPSALRGGSTATAWNRGTCELYLSNGSYLHGYTSEKPGGLRGPQFHGAWIDEPAKLKDAYKGRGILDTTWTNLMLALRLGEHPHVIVTGTPKRVLLMRELVADDRIVKSYGTTLENLDNLAPNFREQILSSYEGTTLGRQEIYGELLDEVEGALWTHDLIESTRIDPTQVPPLRRTTVGVDPAGTNNPKSDETGIVVVGADMDGHGYVLDDLSGHYGPEVWARLAIEAWDTHDADVVVYERNMGQEMARQTLQVAADEWARDHPGSRYCIIAGVWAAKAKLPRAEPVVMLYQQKRFHHAGVFPLLEDQLTSWNPSEDKWSPDRLDALVWAARDCVLGESGIGTTNAAQLAEVHAPPTTGDAVSSVSTPGGHRSWSASQWGR